MTDKSQALIDELVAACIAFGRGQLPDWQTRIETAQRELREYIAELEAENEKMKKRVTELAWTDRPTVLFDLKARIAELESELVTTKQKLTDCEARNAELEKSSDELAEELSDMESAKDDVFDEAWKLKAKVVELETLVEKLIEVGDWAITGMAIATSYSSSKMNDLAERRRDEWCALIKKWAESEK